MNAVKTSWEPLPQRRKKARNGGGTADADSSVQNNTLNQKIDESQQDKNRRIVEENVTRRSNFVKKEGTLESKDGCAGEFYEYLDHTADVQCHSWGKDIKEAFEHMAPCMFNYMTDLALVDIVDSQTIEFTVDGHDMDTLLFKYMDELLFRFCTDNFCCKVVEIIEFDKVNFKIVAKGYGELFDQAKHPQGTEIKAITYSNMQIHETEDRADLYVIVDI